MQWSTDTSSAAAAARALEQLTDGAAALVTAGKSAGEARAAPPVAAMAALAVAPAAGGSDEEEEEEEDEAVTALRTAYGSAKDGAAAAAALKSLAFQGPEHRAHVAVTALLVLQPGAPPLAKQLEAARLALAAAAPDAAGRAALLAALEAGLAGAEAAVLKGTALGLKALYDGDVVDEAALVAWYDAPAAARKFGVSPAAAAAVRKASHAFVDWLRNAEDEDEEDDE